MSESDSTVMILLEIKFFLFFMFKKLIILPNLYVTKKHDLQSTPPTSFLEKNECTVTIFNYFLTSIKRTAGNATVVITRGVFPTFSTLNKYILETPLRKIIRVSIIN